MLHCRFGDHINDYEVQHLLGKGGFATVYQAQCLKSKKIVAIKMIDKQLIQGSVMANRVRQEIEIHSRLKHPSVLELYTFFQDTNFVYLVLELAENGELHQYMKHLSRPFLEVEAALILRQVVDGLLYLHSHQIMHRDISLSNLLLTKNMHVKIADFGLATQLKKPDERHITMCGTPNYISPEVVSRASHGLPADVWSVGCMLYTLLCGRPPFDTDGVHLTLKKVVMSDYHIPQYLSYDARDLIKQLLKKNPSERISLQEVLRHPFMSLSMTTAAGTAAQKTPNANNVSSDSGINTFDSYSSNSLRLRSIERTIPSTLPKIQEEFSYLKRTQPIVNYVFSDNKPKQQLMSPTSSVSLNVDGVNMDCQNIFDNFSLKSTALLVNKIDENENLLQKNANASQMIPGIPLASHFKIQPPISIPILNTTRLQPTRYKTRNAVMSILSNGDVTIEFIKFKSQLNEDRITDLCRISKDGHRIEVFHLDPGRSLPIRDFPTEVISNKNCIYYYDNLPSKHWKKYAYAARFVGLVKSKTPKVTYFSTLAKCHLMESLTDFEMCFYSGDKVIKSPKEGVRVFNQNGIQLNDQSSSAAKLLLDHLDESLRHCLAISSALEVAQTNNNICFPAVIGRRPALDHHKVIDMDVAMPETANIIYSTPKSQQGLINFSLSTISSSVSTHHEIEQTPPSQNQLVESQTNVPIKRINISDVGVATELSHGGVQVQFFDGSYISVIPKAQGGGVTYTQSNGASTHFNVHDELPFLVRDKLNLLPQIQRHLNSVPVNNKTKFENKLMIKSFNTPISSNCNQIKFFR